MYPPPSSSKSTAPDGGDSDVNPYNSSIGTTRDFSSLNSQIHHPPPSRQQHNPNVVGHYFADDPSSMGFDSGASSSSLFRHRSSPAGFYDQYLPTDPNGRGFSLGRPNGGGGGESEPSRLKSEVRFSDDPRNSGVAAINNVASTSMSFGNDRNNKHWDTSSSSSNISFTIGQSGRGHKNTDFFTLESQYCTPQTSSEMARMESLMNIPEDSVPCRLRAKRGHATHPRSIAERERRMRITGKLKKLQEQLQELVPNMDKQTSYADMLDLAVEHIKSLQLQVESLEKGIERCTCGAFEKR